MLTIGQMQSGVMRSLAAELRAGGLGAAMLAAGLGALHALTPGHGKAAVVAYFLGQEARITKGLRIALSGALLHVVSGFVAFLILRFALGQAPSISGRGSPTFTLIGYGFVMLAGLMMLYQALRPDHAHSHGDGHTHTRDGGHALTAGIGLLPCPLTISVLGFAWLQGSALMVGVVLMSLALGISLTIGLVALGAILARKGFSATLVASLPGLERFGRAVQVAAAVAIIAFAGYAMWRV
jgi:ABC-type nickel/cobalt efflux system permease component RcnA